MITTSFPGYGRKKIRVGALERGFLSFRLSLRSDEELEFSFLSPPSGGEEGSDIGGFPLLATARRKVRVPAASRAAKKQQLRFAFT